MRVSVDLAAAAGNPQVFHLLLDVVPSVSELCAQDRDWALSILCRAATGGSTDISSSRLRRWFPSASAEWFSRAA